MKRKFWSAGMILLLAVIVVSLALLYYFAWIADFGDKPPNFGELQVVSGQLEDVKYSDRGEADPELEIKLLELSTVFRYGHPHLGEVYLALGRRGTAELWVDGNEVWQVVVDSVVISSYQDRVAWGKSNATLGKIIVSFFVFFFLDAIPGGIIYRRLKGR